MDEIIDKNYISIICPIYNSPVIFYEQLLYLSRILKGLDKDVEMIFVDDGSKQSLIDIYNKFIASNKLIFHKNNVYLNKRYFDNFKILETKSKLAWNQPAARNLGAKHARGNYLLFFDIDHIITRGMVEDLFYFHGDMFRWCRRYAILKDGKIYRKKEFLVREGLKPEINLNKKFGVSNIFGIKKEIFDKLGGYDEQFCGRYGGDDTDFMKRFGYSGYRMYTNKQNMHMMYVYPNPRISKKFHDLHRQAGKVKRGNEQKI